MSFGNKGNTTNHTHQKGGNRTNHPKCSSDHSRKPHLITVGGITKNLAYWSDFLGYNHGWASWFLKKHTEEELIAKIEERMTE